MRARVLAIVVLLLAGLAAYSNSFTDLFAGLDAKESVRDNPYIRHLWPLSDAMSLPLLADTLAADEGSKGGTFVRRPLLSLTFALNQALLGTRPRDYQAVNLAIHLCAGLLLYGLVCRTLLLPRFAGRWRERREGIACAIALLWLVHPLHTESVTNLVQRAESLMGALYLLTLYATARLCGGGHAWGWGSVALVACAYGMGTKETMVTAPVAALLYDLIVAGNARDTLRQRWCLHTALFSTWLILIVLIATTAEDAARDFEEGKTIPYILSQPQVVLHYLRLAFWPDALHVYVNTTQFLHVDGVTPMRSFWLPAIALAGAMLAALWGCWRRHPLGFVGLAFFLYLAPTSSIVATSDVLQEHRMYLALACVVTLVVCGADRLLAGRRLGRGLGIALVALAALGLGARTYARNFDYHSEFGMIHPGDMRQALIIVARHEFARGELGRALEHFDAAMAELTDPYARGEAHYDLGNLFLRAQRPAEAKLHFDAAVAVLPELAPAQNNLGALLAVEGDLDGAEYHLRQAVWLFPRHFLALSNLGMVFAMQGNRSAARESFQASVQLVPQLEIAAKGILWLDALPPDLVPRCDLQMHLTAGYSDAFLIRAPGPGEECQ